MSVTIDSLDIQIRSSAGSAAKNINDLATALGNLNANAKVTKIVNSLERLNGALTNMKGQQAVMSHLSALTKSLSSLAALPELTGLKSAVKELKKLPDVMKSLDTAEISQFAAKMKLLANGLGPLATQIDKIGKGFSKLPPQVSKCVTAVKRLDSANKSAAKSTRAHGEALNSQSFNLLAAYENLSNVFSMIHGIQDAFAKLLNDAIQWDGIQFQFGRAFGEDAEEVLAYAEKISGALHINQQQFMESASLYGSLLKGFGVEQELVSTMGVGLAELSYDIWAAYNNRYKTLEDASEAVRSAITGEIEPIRNAGIALTEASMQEYLDSVGKAHISIEKLTEAQKSEVRYATMVNAAMQQGIIGTYAREMETAEGAVRTLTQQLKTLGQAIGSLFIPVLKVAIPYLTAFVELLTEAFIALGRMFGINFQEITWGDATGMTQTADGANATADALGDAAKNAKKMKDYALGFDELNVIKPPDESSSAAVGGLGSGDSLGLGLETLWDDSVFAQASKQVDELKIKIVDFYNKWKWQINTLGIALSLLSITSLLTQLGNALNLGKLFLGTMAGIKSLAVGAIVITLQYTLATEFLKSYLDGEGFKNYIAAMFVNALGTWILYSKFGTTGLVIGLSITAAASIKALIEDGGINGTEGAVTALTGLASAAAAIGIAFKKVKGAKFVADLGAAFSLLKEGASIGGVFAALFPKLSTAFTAIGTAVSGAVTAIAGALGISVGWVVAIAAAIVAAIVAIVVYWDEIKLFFTEILPQWISTAWNAITQFFGNAWVAVSGFFRGLWEDVKSIWSVVAAWFDETVIQPLVSFFEPIVEWIGEFFRGCWMIVRAVWVVASEWFNEKVVKPIGGFFSELGKIVKKIFSKLWQGVKDIWVSVSTWFNETVVAPVVEWFRAAWTNISGFFSQLWEDIKEIWKNVSAWFNEEVITPLTEFFSIAWSNIKEAFETAFIGIRNFAVGVINGLIGIIESMINRVIDGINWLVGGFSSLVSWAAKVLKEDWSGLALIPNVSLPRIEIEAKANGGFVGAGQMFVAREAGPELVGSINGRTAVANNDQIVAAVSRGVYEAVAAAMSANSGSGGQSINIYLDGKQITAAVEKRQGERGRTLMGNQLGYVY